MNFILSLFTESLSPKKDFLDLNLRKTVTVFTVERQILLITPLLIACLQNHSARKCCNRFDAVNASSFSLGVKELLFGLVNKSDVLARKLSYTLLFTRYYIFKRKLLTDSLLVSNFINQVNYKYRLEGSL